MLMLFIIWVFNGFDLGKHFSLQFVAFHISLVFLIVFIVNSMNLLTVEQVLQKSMKSTRKPVFVVSYQVRHKLAFSVLRRR